MLVSELLFKKVARKTLYNNDHSKILKYKIKEYKEN